MLDHVVMASAIIEPTQPTEPRCDHPHSKKIIASNETGFTTQKEDETV